jgi:hypothetical protein
MAEADAPHVLGVMIRRRFEHSEFHAAVMRPLDAEMATTLPW